jgi:hypothetical protein
LYRKYASNSIQISFQNHQSLLLEKIKMNSYISAQPLKMQLAAHLLQNRSEAQHVPWPIFAKNRPSQRNRPRLLVSSRGSRAQAAT